MVSGAVCMSVCLLARLRKTYQTQFVRFVMSVVSECPLSSSSSSKIQCTKGERQNYQKEIMIQLLRGCKSF